MSQGIKRFFSLASETAKENAEFLNHNAKHVAGEVVGLVDDAIDYMTFFIKQEKAIEVAVRQAMVFYVNHLLMPESYSVFVNFWLGNIPSCFRGLRFMVESLAKFYLADIKYPHQSFFETKLELLGKECKSRNNINVPKREHDFIEEFDRRVGLNGKSVKLWGQLSQEVHTKKHVKRVVDHIIEKAGLPAYALAIPMGYTKGDLEGIQELHNFICGYRKILDVTMKHYQSGETKRG